MTSQEAKLPALPASGDEFWEYANTEMQKEHKVKACEHYFIHKTATEVECRNCRIGFFLSPGFATIDGNLVDPDGVVIRLQGSALVNG